MQPDLAQLRALSAALAEGTFDAAARRLHVTPSAVSQRLQALEREVGQVLLVRSKPVRTTAAGDVLLRLARQVELLVAEASAELGGDAAPTAVALAVNADSLATWLLPALTRAGDQVFDLKVADQDDTAALLRRGAVSAAITSQPEPVPGCTVERLGAVRYRPAAAPTFARRWFADGVDAASLTRAPVVVFDRSDGLQGSYLRRHGLDPAAPPTHHVPSTADFLTAVRLGLGWGMLPDLQSGPDLDAGALVLLDPAETVDVVLFWQQWRLSSAVLDGVADAVRAAARAQLRP